MACSNLAPRFYDIGTVCGRAKRSTAVNRRVSSFAAKNVSSPCTAGLKPCCGPAIMTERYLEDFHVGQTFGSATLRVDAERIKRFAAEFDPQPFHLDEESARETMFDGLAASGWHTAALTMRLLVQSNLNPAGGLIGASVEELRWPRPVRPGDELRIASEVIEV